MFFFFSHRSFHAHTQLGKKRPMNPIYYIHKLLNSPYSLPIIEFILFSPMHENNVAKNYIPQTKNIEEVP